MVRIVNKQGSTEQWSADVLHGGVFAARLSVSTQDSVQTVRLRRMVEGRTTRSVLAEWKSPAARPWGMDAIEDMVVAALDGGPEPRGPGRPEVGPMINVRMNPAMIAALDDFADRHGLSRAETVRQMIATALAE